MSDQFDYLLQNIIDISSLSLLRPPCKERIPFFAAAWSAYFAVPAGKIVRKTAVMCMIFRKQLYVRRVPVLQY